MLNTHILENIATNFEIFFQYFVVKVSRINLFRDIFSSNLVFV